MSYDYYHGGTSSPSTSTYKVCEHEPSHVTEINGISFWAATHKEIKPGNIPAGALVINNGGPSSLKTKFTPKSIFKKLPPGWDSLNKSPYRETLEADEIYMEWRDFAAPPLKPEFWGILWDAIQTQGYTDIVFTCLGGHGRTGTSLCSVLIAAGLTAEEAVTTIRSNYCSQAVENDDQAEYLVMLSKFYHDVDETIETLNRIV